MSRHLCECGCGQEVALIEQTNLAMGRLAGQPNRFVHGHNGNKREEPDYIVDGDGCWVWQKGTTGNGYGALADGTGAHRAYYEAATGGIPGGRQIHHRCEKPACVNPDHLECLTVLAHAETRRDTKLSVRLAEEIRSVAGQFTRRELASRYGVSVRTIGRVIRREAWCR